MRGLAEVLIAALDLLAAEGRRVGRAQYRALRAGAVAFAFAFVLAAGFGFLLTALYLALAPAVGPPVAALLTGIVASVVGGAGLVATRWLLD